MWLLFLLCFISLEANQDGLYAFAAKLTGVMSKTSWFIMFDICRCSQRVNVFEASLYDTISSLGTRVCDLMSDIKCTTSLYQECDLFN